MRAECHIYTPHGDAMRRLVGRLCDVVRDSNKLWINALLNSSPGVRPDKVVPRCAKVAGISYRPPQGAEKLNDRQAFYAAPQMFQRGHGSCGDIAAYDAACLEVLYNVRAWCQVVSQDGTSYHANVMTEFGVYDPTGFRNWNDPKHVLPPLSGDMREVVRRLCSA